MRRAATVLPRARRRRRPGAVRPSITRGRLRTGLTLAGILLVAASTQVIPSVPLPRLEVSPVAAALPAVPFEARIQANLELVARAVGEAEGELAEAYRTILGGGRQLLSFDPEANQGRGAWAELIGTIDEHTRAVGILVPGSSAFVVDHNFDKYHRRAQALVDESDGTLAMVVWASGSFPKGWIQGSMSRYHESLGRSLALFSHELRSELTSRLGPDQDVRVVVAGHSFGGAVVGAAERYGLTADAVLHIASAGVGRVRDPYDFPEPQRPRYAMTAPGDLIGFVQGLPTPPGFGHGPDPEDFRCVTELPTGRFPDDPAALDERGRQLGDRAGAAIEGVPSHSEVFIRYSDAWWGIYRVLTGAVPPPPGCPPPADPEPMKARVLPLVVPRVVTASQCRAGDGLRPRGRRAPVPRPRS